MSEELAHYTFLPWFRRGLSAQIDTRSDLEDQRATIPIPLYLNQTPLDPQGIKLHGPSDVIGFDHRIIIRTDPKDNVGDFEPNYFPFIEFSDPDFPWRFTPTKSETGDKFSRLRPWICLIVLKAEGEASEYEPGKYSPDRPLPYIKVKKNGDGAFPLPDLDYSWKWAHVQVTSDLLQIEDDNSADDILTAAQAALEEILRTEPARAISRVMCARRLEARVLYHAFVVPTFKGGVLAGQGNTINEGDIQLLENAWDDEDELELPYYYKWEFRTGARGDFEYLVRLLQPREIDDKVGKRNITCSKPGYNVPAVERTELSIDDPARHVLELEGALTTVDAKPTQWPAESDNAFQEKLRELLNLPEQNLKEVPSEPPIIAPPIYSRWHAATKEVRADNPRWLNKLNMDPRYRTIAGFGTLVIQDQQEKLMASAWKQVGSIEEANELLRQAQFARETSERILKRHLIKLPRGSFLRVAAPLHSRVLIAREKPDGNSEKVTVIQHFRDSPVPSAAFDPAFRRILRKRGPIRKRQRPDVEPNRKDILDRLNSGEVAAAGEHPTPDAAPGVGDVSELFRPSWAKGWFWGILKHIQKILLIIALATFLLLLLLNAYNLGPSPTNPLFLAVEVLLLAMILIARRLITPGLIADNVQEENFTPQAVKSSPARPAFELTSPGSDSSSGGIGGSDSVVAAAFRNFAIKAQEFLNYSPPEKPQPKPIDLSVVRTTLLDALDPNKTIVARTKQRLLLQGLKWREDTLEPIMAAPEFPQPMYEALRDISQELFLPGLQFVPQNTLGLLQTNQRFINSYMSGLNHEFARELLWREYPTDQRGSYFRQFWDVSGFIPTQKMLNDIESEIREEMRDELEQLTDEEKQEVIEERLSQKLKDIKPIHQWGNVTLDNNNRLDSGLKESLVLLVRGDLLKKYPTAVIYAAKGKWERDDGRDVRRPILDQSEDNTKTPMFSGTLPPDVTFFGLDLTKEEARGSKKKEENLPGWFIVIEERISEARFGMDVYADGQIPVLETWEDLSWRHFTDNLSNSGYIDGASPSSSPRNEVERDNEVIEPDGVTWDSHAANIAWITMQKPMRVAVHADDMLPKEE